MTSFSKAFAAARKEKGPGKTFEWNGKKYTTDLASETAKKPTAKTAPPRRPAPKAAIPVKDRVTTPTTSPRPRPAASGVAAAKPKVDTVARDMLNNNIVKATGDKLAADRKKTSSTPSTENKKELTFGQAFRQGKMHTYLSNKLKKSSGAKK